MFAETDGLRHAVLGNGEILRAQAFNGVAFLVFYDDRLHHKLSASGDGGRGSGLRLRILPDLLGSDSQYG